ncbi:MAG TPA: galactosyl-1-phosphate transferase, partial [Synechococcales bacterium UBA8647]|nr:galactosyl-1-phosphate transferase [Synechococcales bacterium UBA8647]
MLSRPASLLNTGDRLGLSGLVQRRVRPLATLKRSG